MRNIILKEIKSHLPETLIGAVLGTVIVFLILKIESINPIALIESLFHIIHPAHIFVSAIATSAVYYRYKTNILNAVLLGVVGSIFIGSLSDIVFPYLGGTLLNLNTEFHLEVLEKPLMIISVSIVGSLIGAKTKISKGPHLLHVLLSVFASIFYLFAFSSNISIFYGLLSSLVVFFAVLIPCCVSDIIFPLFFVKNEKK